jgi:ribosomal protein S27E
MDFPETRFTLKNDRYAKNRGAPHKFLYIMCAGCNTPAMVYQKDGPGRLLRCYSDRIVWPPELVDRQRDLTAETVKSAGNIACSECEQVLATPMVYKPENRPAYHVMQGTIHMQKGPTQTPEAI